MKTILALLLTLTTHASAQTNEPILFTAHLTGHPFDIGKGMFSLTDRFFTYNLLTPSGFNQAAIYGPAQPGTDGPLILALQLTACIPTQEDVIGMCLFGSPIVLVGFTLSEQQASDLLAGLWYVRAVPPTDPSFSVRGQILQVPEPSTTIFLLSLAALYVCYDLRRLLGNKV